LPDKKGTQSKAATHINMQHPHTNTHTPTQSWPPIMAIRPNSLTSHSPAIASTIKLESESVGGIYKFEKLWKTIKTFTYARCGEGKWGKRRDLFDPRT